MTEVQGEKDKKAGVTACVGDEGTKSSWVREKFSDAEKEMEEKWCVLREICVKGDKNKINDGS